MNPQPPPQPQGILDFVGNYTSRGLSLFGIDVSIICVWNAMIFGVIAVILNALLLLSVIRQNDKMGSFKQMMILVSSFDIIFSIWNILTCPAIVGIPELGTVLLLKEGIRVNLLVGRIILIIYIFLLCQSIVIPPFLFVYRYVQICRSTWLFEPNIVYSIIIFPFFLSFSSASLISYSSWPSQNDIFLFGPLIESINSKGDKGAFLIASVIKALGASDKAQSIVMFVGGTYCGIILISLIIIVLFCSHKIVNAVNNVTSKQAKALQKQLHKTLLSQFLIPLLCLHIPFFVSVVATIFGFKIPIVTYIIPILFAWYPVINALVAFILVRDFAQFVFGCSFCTNYTTSITKIQPTDTTKSDSH